MGDAVEIAVGVGEPVANNLGMIGLIIVIVVVPVLCGLLFLLKYLIDHIKAKDEHHAAERIEWKDDANKREARAEKRDEKNIQAMDNFTKVIKLVHNIDG